MMTDKEVAKRFFSFSSNEPLIFTKTAFTDRNELSYGFLPLESLEKLINGSRITGLMV